MVRKSRNFDGCWTCRSRKVKCDLRRPKCQRCIKAGIDCAGYNIKLGWSNPLTISKDNNALICLGSEENDGNSESTFQRRNIDFVKFSNSSLYETFKEVSNSLNKLEIISQQNKSPNCRVGPFSVYSIEGLKRQKLSGQEPYEWQNNYNDESDSENSDRNNEIYNNHNSNKGTDYNSRNEIEGSIFSKNNNSWVHYELLDSAKLTTLAIKGIDYKLNEQNMLHILYPKFFPNIDSDDWLADQSILGRLFYKLPVSNDLQLTSLFKELLNKFKEVTLSFVRVKYANNYWETIVMPFINNIICEFVCMNFASWTNIKMKPEENANMSQLKNHIKLGIVYLSFSLSAIQISNGLSNNVINENETYHMNEYLKLSIELRKMSITLLDYHLDEYDNNMDDNTNEYENLLLLCIILQIQADNYFSVFENYELLFAIGGFILQSKFKETDALSDLSKYLTSTFRLISVFFESTHSINVFTYSIDPADEENYKESGASHNLIEAARKKLGPDLPVKPWIPTPGVDTDSIYLMYGIPRSLIKLFKKAVDLTNHKNIFRARNEFPRHFFKVCADVEQLISEWDVNVHWKLYNEKYNPILKEIERVYISRFHQALFHYIMAFHNALKVYFYRLVQDATPDKYQRYIQHSLAHLRELVTINRQVPEFEFKPSFWALLVCGSDAIDVTLHRDIKSLWSSKEMGYFNYWRGKQLLYEVWKRREIGETHSWMDMVREWDIVLCLV
ncbi:DEHA2E16302p [Debaryomyces hansenii CBS767]|uniref:DEHA2E16302p n=1 Tax=Debaryomyces hansenii (strain ATCC 36239 / CBS 767 / BCRC 21394 / JCM 1990 / NBRC 0083 / IGC 2968) TaxID=284592 RepID=Q6BP60_DEBHA|nr:DEHA2E16302p [Debaryomyces hansenii CBS767]CAG88263.2 DEHA2E16302p [Debaryomyces hansenii CBS767]|eukprot:XP_460010.2 DEHA2E16302p [Debaryomyces hansenii CBS767]